MPWEGGLAPEKLLRPFQIYAEITPTEVDLKVKVRPASGGRGKQESGLLGQRHTWGLTAKIQPAECGSVFRLHNNPRKSILLVSPFMNEDIQRGFL